MTKYEFLAALEKGLHGLSREERQKWLDFYDEMIDDRTEDGLSQEEAVAEIGSVESVIGQIMLQSEPSKSEKRELKPTHWTLLIVSSPIWFSLYIALFAGVWSIVICTLAAGVSLVGSGLGGIVMMIALCAHGNVGGGLLLGGAGIFCIGLGILCLLGLKYVVKGAVWATKKPIALVFSGKEAAK